LLDGGGIKVLSFYLSENNNKLGKQMITANKTFKQFANQLEHFPVGK